MDTQNHRAEELGLEPGDVPTGGQRNMSRTCDRRETAEYQRLSIWRPAGILSAIVAVAWNRDVGVDVEGLRRIPDALSVASRFFHRDEAEFLRHLPDGSANDAFLRLWTMKEAFAKCRGLGLSLPLDSFSILESTVRKAYTITSVQVPNGFVATVVYPSPPLVHKVLDVER